MEERTNVYQIRQVMCDTAEVEVVVTLPTLHHDTSPEAMTRRARWYLGVAASRHLSIGVVLLIFPWLFGNAAFIPILNALPLWGWGALMVICGTMCFLAAYLRSSSWARWAMNTSATITTVLAGGVWIGVAMVWIQWANDLRDFPPSPILPILLTTLAAKDFIVCAQPIRSPFEAVARQVMGE